jgi:hypothetical protein
VFFASLQIIPATPATKAEFDLIEATHTLWRLYNNIASQTITPPLPIQIRLQKDRLDLISVLLEQTTRLSNSEIKSLIDVGKRLVASQNSSLVHLTEIRIRGLIANWAMEHGNVETAMKVVKEMIDQASRAPSVSISESTTADKAVLSEGSMDEAWRVCVRLVREAGRMIDTDFKRQLVGFALEYCEPHSMSEVLDVSKAIDIETLAGGDDVRGKLVSNNIKGFLDVLDSRLEEEESESGLRHMEHFGIHQFYNINLSEALPKSEILIRSKKQAAIEAKYTVEMLLRHRELLWKKKTVHREKLSELDDVLLNLAKEAYNAGDAALCLVYLAELHKVRTAGLG